MQELGVGGPKIYSQYGLVSSDYNHGKATLNTAYPARLSAAVHEIGHALGLDHTQNKDSVMYPVDQGKTTLTTQDLDNLKKFINKFNSKLTRLFDVPHETYTKKVVKTFILS